MGWKKGLTLPASLIAGDKLIFYLRKLSLQTQGIFSFDDLPIPFRAVAADVETGDLVILSKGDFAQALRATMAIPGVFAPQEVDGRLLVDGFLTQNLPVSLARDWQADVIIAVDVGAPLYARDELAIDFEIHRPDAWDDEPQEHQGTDRAPTLQRYFDPTESRQH